MIRALFLAGFAAVASATPALAHAVLASSQPADGAVLAEAPRAVILDFEDDVRIVSLLLTRDGAGDVTLSVDPPGAFRGRVRAPLPKLSPGVYGIEWRAAAKDMHAMSGVLHFTIAGSSAPAR